MSRADRKVLDELVRQGVDLSEVRLVEHVFDADSAEAARAAEQALRDAGFQCETDLDEHGLWYVVTARHRVDLSEQSVVSFASYMAQVQERSGATHDGWGTLVT